MSVTKPLLGKVALVTGAGGTMGRAVAQALIDDGCRLGAIDLNHDALASLQQAHGDAVCAVRCDIGDPADVQRAHRCVVGALGEVDVLVNNAGILSNSKLIATQFDEWRRVVAANLDGARTGA